MYKSCLLKLGFLVLFLNHTQVYSQFRIYGNIAINDRWEKKLYILRIDKLELDEPILIDSIEIQNNGDFDYSSGNFNPQGLLYKVVLPPRGSDYHHLIEGHADNYFLFSSAAPTPLKVKANADSLYYSLQIEEGGINRSLLTFRDMKRPFYNLSMLLADSIKSNPEGMEKYKREFIPVWMKEIGDIKSSLFYLLDTANTPSMILAGLYYLYAANIGRLDSATIMKSLSNVDIVYKEKMNDIVLVRNLQNLANNVQSHLTNMICPNVELIGNQGVITNLYDQVKKVTVIDFWASWCKPCRYSNKYEIPEIIKSYGNEIGFLGITLDGNPEKWRRAIEDDEIFWRQYMNVTDFLKTSLNIQSLPLYIALDNNKRIIYECSTIYEMETYLKNYEKP